VEFNLFEKADGDSEIISNKSADNIIRYNTMRDSRAGLCLRGGRNVLVEGNAFFNTAGMRVFGEGHVIVNNYFEETGDGICLPAGQHRAGAFVDRKTSGSYEAASRVLVAHNTIINSRKCGIDLGRDLGQVHQGVVKKELPHDISVVNNLVTGTGWAMFKVQSARTVRWEKNIAYPLGKGDAGLTDPGILRVDPRCVQKWGLWRLPPSGSPAENAGVVLKAVSLDYDGQKRDGAPDIGCDEVSGDRMVNGPLQARHVGPSWMKAGR
jgi:parallel beta-helix repeat protein